ncbi:MAG: alkaline phosphatase family protein [Desulfocapsa sp.]|nr:alkaline phosphatase family protein [Desulfocapsa sp.]
MLEKNQRVIVAMMDGLDMEYVEQTSMPNLQKMMADGFFKEVSGVFPSVTNVNNVSIACGAWPNEHGISANSYFDKETGKPEYMNAQNLIRCPTIFKRAKDLGIKTALLTSKKKTLELFRQDVTIGIAAEAATEDIISKHGKPADIYSAEINYWLWEVACSILVEQPDIQLLYVHITDYPMHAWGPEKKESQGHLETLDILMGKAIAAAPDAAFLVTADHGMNYKRQCWDLKRVLEEEGLPARFVLSPERDYYIVHHRNFTGCSWVWLNKPEDIQATIEIIEKLSGVEKIYTKEDAARIYNLPSEHIGDLVVSGDKDTMFGEMDTAYEKLPSTYRAHGSLHEMRLPLVIWNIEGEIPGDDQFQHNLDLTKFLYR